LRGFSGLIFETYLRFHCRIPDGLCGRIFGIIRMLFCCVFFSLRIFKRLCSICWEDTEGDEWRLGVPLVGVVIYRFYDIVLTISPWKSMVLLIKKFLGRERPLPSYFNDKSERKCQVNSFINKPNNRPVVIRDKVIHYVLLSIYAIVRR